MEERKSKTAKEIFQEKYNPDYIKETTPYGAIEAVGYLKCLKQFLPTDKWIEEYETTLMNLVAIEAVRGIINGKIK